MRKLHLSLCSLAATLVSMFITVTIQAQGTPLAVELLPLGKDIDIKKEQSVTPTYEGWYENEDGAIALSFGFNNCNSEEILNIPMGSTNRTVEEMAHNWVDVTYLGQEEYEAIVAGRSAAAGGGED